jgi:predicted solute-binding protein
VKRSLSVGLWNLPFADTLAAALDVLQPSSDVVRGTPENCARLLASGEVDAALVPTLSAFLNPERFDILPAFALSSWRYPFARIFLSASLDAHSSELVIPPDASQEAFVAGVVLQEHYGTRVLAVRSDVTPGPNVNHLQIGMAEAIDDPRSLDLGQEWFELSGYPMVWGLMAMAAGSADQGTMRLVRDLAATAERLRAEVAAGLDENVGSFIMEDLRFRMDDLATASLTELAEYVFYYSGTDDPAELNIVSIEEADQNGAADDEFLPAV